MNDKKDFAIHMPLVSDNFVIKPNEGAIMKNVIKLSVLSIFLIGFVACESLDEKEVSTDTSVEDRLEVSNEDVVDALDGSGQKVNEAEPMDDTLPAPEIEE